MKYLAYIIIVCGIFISCKHTSSGTTEPKDFLLKLTVKNSAGQVAPHLRISGGCLIANQPKIAIQVIKIQMTVRDSASSNILFNDSSYAIPAEVDFSNAPLGYTSDAGTFEMNDIYRFPGLLNLSPLSQTDENGISSGTFSITNTVEFILTDTITNLQESYEFNLKNGHNNFQLTWNPASPQLQKINDDFSSPLHESNSTIHKNNILSGIDTSWNNINIADSTRANRSLYLVRKDLVANPGYYELPPVPPVGSFDVRFSSQRSLETYPETLATDSIYKYRIWLQSSHYPLTLRWKFQCPPAFHLSESIDGQAINTRLLCGRDSLTILNSNVNGLIITIPKNQNQPLSFKLNPNYPHPFIGSTLIPFTLASTCRVTLSITTLDNRLIEKLLDNELFNAGFQEKEYKPKKN